MSHAFTFGFDDNGNGNDNDNDNDVEEVAHNLLNESQIDIREDSARQMNPNLEEPRLHALQEMVLFFVDFFSILPPLCFLFAWFSQNGLLSSEKINYTL